MKIKRGFVLLVLLILMPLASATVIINQQPQSVYNLGDVVTIPVTFKPVQDSSGVFNMDLVCSGFQINFYKNGISVSSGDEKIIEASLILMKDIIGESIGTCKVKAYLGSDFVLTNDFIISNVITVQSDFSATELSPGDNIIIKGNAVKENGNAANGFVELTIVEGNSTAVSQTGTLNNGIFSLNTNLPKDIKSGNYLLRVSVYEEELSGVRTNTGIQSQNIFIRQVPTSLEIVFEEKEIEPGTSMNVKAILHDQTGVGIASSVFITIKNSKDKILEQTEISTEEFLEFPIAYNEPPSSWKVVAASNKLTSESTFQILEKESAEIEISNKTVLITNTGNIPYNKTVLVKIGDQSLNIDVYLKVDESQRWLLTAPDGEYDVEVISEGQQVSAGGVLLTGDAIDIRKASAGVGSLVRFPVVWIFILAILGFVAFIVFKRGYQKSFFGYISSGIQKRKESKDIAAYNPRSKAELALSIKGDKQDVSMIALKVKNMGAVKTSTEGGAKEILNKIINAAEEHKAATYENNDNLFFIFAPIRTKTFRNEETALKVSQKIKSMLHDHNKLFKQKVDFGISLNHGEIIAKQEPDSFKFMGMGNFMTHSKKIASLAENDVIMGEKMKDKLAAIVKTEKHKRDGIDVYFIKEIKDHEKHEKFLKGFMKRQEKG
jgi:hypothetical protein